MGAPYGGFSIPPACVPLLDGGEDVNTDVIAGDVTVDLCEDCTELARRMVLDHQTTPLPECDADAARWEDAGIAEVMLREEVSSGDMTGRMMADALGVVKAHRDGDAGRTPESKVVEAYTIVLSLERLGLVETGFFD